ncbi:hypothetical protein KP509_09G054000 [Ceratopteris richardii]|uniref:CCR4-NOT transcription complex subunit 3 n=1 Tax=Ceratopteris richardii TaxID=49495 RepID=A0A8T2U1D1_CERRI|nr:hypothetical protein KP509_09G054000 [Ceratopteris richardii]
MGATRKLQGEIDKVLKKVQEGVDVFDSIWNKVYDTENANQKEKFEADLKKEIKKLQRYRDQIKTWLQSSEIKDKKALMDSRKLIEREMERFKICEKETKTKAFSKEGLGQQPKTDPREKAKSESRDWLNNMVSELESQIDSFEAELEGLTAKKGKSKSARLAHLEDSISRHKQHIVKLEQILRLLDNDSVSPEEVNDTKDFVEDYVERNQEDFDEFSDVNALYSSIPVEKFEALENMDSLPNLPPSLLPKEKVPKDTHSIAQSSDDGSIQQTPVENVSKTLPLQTQQDQALVGSVTVPGINPPVSPLNGTSALGIGSPAILSSIKTSKVGSQSVPQSPGSFTSAAAEEDEGNYPGRNIGLARGTGRGTLPLALSSGQTTQALSIGMPTSSVVGSLPSGHSIGSSGPDLSKRSTLGNEERFTGALSQQLNPSTPQNRFMQPIKSADISDAGLSIEGGVKGGTRLFSSPGSQWRSPGAAPFQASEPVTLSTRTEVNTDQKPNFIQRLHLSQQQLQQHANPILAGAQQMVHAGLTSQKQSTVLQQQSGLTIGGTAAATSHSQIGLQQIPIIPSAQQVTLTAGGPGNETDPTSSRTGELSMANLQYRPLDDDKIDGAMLNTPYGRPALKSDDDLKSLDTFDVPVGVSGRLAEFNRWPSNAETGSENVQSAQVALGPGVIGRRSATDVGAIGDSLINATSNDQNFNLQMLQAASQMIPLPQDSEQTRNYKPRHPAVTPSSYPQTPAEIIDNPLFWEHLDTDVLFFAFYYQQGTYQQYLAARELKKQSWRYHKKYNTWFQRHEEPKVTTDEYEQGTYVYFDFHIPQDDYGQGWCQRIKTEFTFEYTFLEDELAV